MSIAGSIRAPFLSSMRRRLGGAQRMVEESVLRRPVSTAFARYLAKNFGRATVEEVRRSLRLLRRLDVRTIGVEDLRSDAAFASTVAGLREAAVRAGKPGPVEVSIVIPVHDKVAHTLVCLASVFRYAPRRAFEVIVGDDASSDATSALVGTLGGPVVYIRQEENLGYLKNCNASAAQARGRHIVLLNNDTLLLPGAIDALIDLLEADPRIGLAGSKLLFGNGRLQEAGGIVWRDASTSNFGRDDDPELPQYNYRKDVDCCAAASIAVRADLWRELGGFDPRYAPAYFEDTDFAFRVREAGLRTLYQPQSVVIHYEAVSHGRDETQGTRKHLVDNRKLFYQRWHGSLGAQCEAGRDFFLARDRSRGRPHLLMIAASVAAAGGGAESQGLYARLLAWAKGGVQLALWPGAANEAAVLQQHGVEVLDEGWQWLRNNGRYLDYIVVGRAVADAAALRRIAGLSSAKIIQSDDDLDALALPTPPISGMDRAS